MSAQAETSPTLHWWRRLAAPSLAQQRLAAFVSVALLRLCVLFASSDTQHFLPTISDMSFYNDWAHRIAGGQWTDHQSFYGLPLYAYFLAGLYSLIGFQPYIALLLQVLAEGATGLLIFRLAPLAFARADDERPEAGAGSSNLIGWLAVLGWGFFVPAQAYSTVLMPTTYFVTAFWFVVWWTMKERTGRPRQRDFFVLGLFIGFVAMMVANILFLAGFVLAALLIKRSWNASLPANLLARWQPRIVAALLLFTGIGLGTSPCWLHNYFVAGEPVLLSAHSGINFWIGNNPEATGYPKVPGGMRADQEGLLRDSITVAEKQVGRPLKHYEVSAYWSAQAHRYIVGHPSEFIRLLGVKLGNFWNAYEYDDLGIIIPMKEDGVLLPGIGFGVAAALGLPGLLLAAARRPRARWVAAAVLLHMASVMSVFVTERYRLAAAPGLLLLGSFGLVEVVRLLRTQQWVPAGTYAALAAGAVLLTLRPLADPGLVYLDDYNSGVSDLESNHLERARVKLERVYAHNPNNAESNFALGNLALADNKRTLAMHFYQRTLQLAPQHYRAMNNLGVLAIEDGEWKAAQNLLTRALELSPRDAKMNYLLARARLALHDTGGARRAIDAAIALEPQRDDYRKFRAEVDRDQTPASL